MSSQSISVPRTSSSVSATVPTPAPPATTLCAGCGKELGNATTLATGDKTYHEGCLACQSCSSSIAGGVKFFLNPGITCASCHEKEFSCAACAKVLDGKYVITGEGEKLHEGCQSLPTCAGCGKVIKGTVKRADGREWHYEGDGFDCFKCSACSTPLGEKFFKKSEDTTGNYCANCVDDRQLGGTEEPAGATTAPPKPAADTDAATPAPACAKCGGAFTAGESFFKLEGKPYHKKCLVCDSCNESVFAGNKLELGEGAGAGILCPKCADLGDGAVVSCDKCGKPIAAGAFTRWGTPSQKLHPACLTCVGCEKVLSPADDIFDKEGKPACASCK
eukprot:CAMPEP_0170752186 /NCGR_PEP_ID=MMETSP0437-20130122/11839_1 /TAXON_ID=0 /ORGANISM="Sexangularia sp." /LENGTH=332 /DNA_ID=CAMNT_0011091249 /DNA_START=85 /DNA_END=1083 /DNA_ORIENTATION=+